MLCGTDPFPEKYRAKKYKIHQKFLSLEEFRFIMRSQVTADSKQILLDFIKLNKFWKYFTMFWSNEVKDIFPLAWRPDWRMSRNLPVAVSEQEIEEMFSLADTDQDQRISYQVGLASLLNIKIFITTDKRLWEAKLEFKIIII